ncbi:hypothetical protein MNBD_PLANCTO02-3215 [hydrothermal vent metagenome]|uniref:Fido domain-containing protein n=1 Tax=hydrothermal vent metagenome TaxID=652676 RepID=A0A3B1DXN6_9ZZZZ
MRKYLESHPFLTFSTYLPDLPRDIWLNAGIAQSKCEEIGRAILPRERKGEFSMLALSKSVHSTTAIEGNTLTEEEVLSIVSDQSKLPDSRQSQAQEVKNIVEAYKVLYFENRLSELAPERGFIKPVSVEKIKEVNKILLAKLILQSDKIVPGDIYQYPTQVGKNLGAPVEDREYLLEKLCKWINEDFQATQTQHKIVYRLISAIFAHLYIAWIHPFGDGNGRTARFIESYILRASGVPEMSAHLLSNHYNLTRTKYYQELDHGRNTKEVHHFLRYAIEGFIDQLNEQIVSLRAYQFESAWRDFVYQSFDDKSNSTITTRRRQVALALWYQREEPVPLTKLRLISPKVAELFAGKSNQVIARDVKALEKMELVVTEESRVRANLDLLSYQS